MMRCFVALLFVLLTGCAAVKDEARLSVAADVGTTAVGIASGVAKEANPMLGGGSPAGLAVSAAIRLGMIEWADTLPEPQRSQSLGFFSDLTWGVVGNNVAVLLGLGAPALVGVAVGLVVHQKRAEFLAICADMMKRDPTITNCVK